MRGLRQQLLSVAQVAHYYPRYSLHEAAAMSSAMRDMLMAIVVSEQTGQQDRLERALGVLWDVDDLTSLSTQKGPTASLSPEDLAKVRVRIPMALAVSGEFFAKVAEPYRAAKRQTEEVSRNAKDKNVTEIASMSSEEAKAFFKNLVG